MKLSPLGVARLKRYEGCELRPYLDSAGLPTVGVGHLLTPEERSLGVFADGISEETADRLLRQDVEWAERAVTALACPPPGAELTQDQFDSLVSLTFNIGSHAFSRSTVLREVNAGAPAEAVRAAFLMWTKRRDPRTSELVEDAGLQTRRVDEASFWS